MILERPNGVIVAPLVLFGCWLGVLVMGIDVREITDKDRERCVWIEKNALPNVIYIDDVWEHFTSKKDGIFLAVEKENELGGFGKLTTLFDDIGWLETIRIHPNYQGQGLGNALYMAYLSHAQALGLKKLGLYTEAWNTRSENLAKKHGFIKKGNFADYRKDVDKNAPYHGSFEPIENHEKNIISKYYGKMNEFCIINKTFFPAIPGLDQELVKRQWAFQDDHGNFVVVGYRMQPHKALFLAYYDGDMIEIINFVNHLGQKLGSTQISCIRNTNERKVINELNDHGFEGVENFMTLWRDIDNLS